jgi:hypothetical protein
MGKGCSVQPYYISTRTCPTSIASASPKAPTFGGYPSNNLYQNPGQVTDDPRVGENRVLAQGFEKPTFSYG